MKVHCLRCGGTVEGPRHSTCACKLPLVADMSTAEGKAINAQAAIKGGENEAAKWGRRTAEARQQAERVKRRFNGGLSSMTESMGRLSAAASAHMASAGEAVVVVVAVGALTAE